jgi:Protein of unknown function (DUF2934)
MATSKKTRQSVAAAPAVAEVVEDQPKNEPLFREDRIRLAAYRLSLSREPGNDDPVADWLEAEAEIDSEDAA